MRMIDPQLKYILKRGVTEIISEEELTRLLQSGRPLRLKQGFDPSRPDIHLGHVVGLRKLRQFQELGHQVVLIVGDWTAQIGDPSGASITRPMLSAEEVQANAKTYMEQFFRVVDKEKTEVRWQSEWFGKFGLADVIRLTSRFTVAQFLAREDFRKRFDAGRPIAITELLYPLLQAYDSVAIKADVEFGGIDQKFNCLVGRELQGMVGQTPQQVFFMPLLVGTDGSQKMSKSLNNYIAIEEPPQEMYGKLMSLPDNLMMDYFELLTDVPDAELAVFTRQLESGSINPMILKKRLAREIVIQFHGVDAAGKAEADFERVIQKRDVPEDISEMVSFASQGWQIPAGATMVGGPTLATASTTDVLCAAGAVKSRSEARRLISQGAVDIVHLDGSTEVASENSKPVPGDKIRVGKHRWVKIVK